MAKLDATGQRWVADLANYHFKINYHSGKQNVDTDALSHIPWEVEQVSAAFNRGLCSKSHIPMVPTAGMYSPRPKVLP